MLSSMLSTLILAGCGGSSPTLKPTHSTAPHRHPSSPSPTGTAAETLAAKSLLRISDLPKGWTATGTIQKGPASSLYSSGASTQSPAKTVQQLMSCAGLPSSIGKLNPPSAAAPRFQSPQGEKSSSIAEQLNEEVQVYPPGDIGTVINALQKPKVPQCLINELEPILTKAASGGVKFNIAVASPPHLNLNIPSASVAFTFTVAVPGQPPNVVYSDVVFMNKGNLFAIVAIDQQGNSPQVSPIKSIVGTAASRL